MSIRISWEYVRRPWPWATLIFILALSLRTCGLSHDLHRGRVYHPDTPKQIRATERFIEGEYYIFIGHRDHEGYPYFNSHLVALSFRAYDAVRHQVRAHLGLPYAEGKANLIALYWLTRLQNAVLSALAAVLVYFMGARFFSRGAGMIGSALLTFSPTDITACRFAAGDTTAAFLALASVFFALKISQQGGYRNYILAAILAAAAFSTKYHGAIALAAAGLAHLSAYPRINRLLSPASVARGGGLVTAFILGILFTSPALLIYPERVFKEIVAFLQYTASFGMTPEMLAMSPAERFQMGMGLNMPVLLDVAGPIVGAAAITALIVYGNRLRIWVIAAVPLLYILGALATKPLAHPVYHTMATPFIMLLAGTVLAGLYTHPTFPRLNRAAAILLTVAALAYLAIYAHREIFFFRHNDSRLLSESWALDNIPPDFHLATSAYTFNPAGWERDAGEAPAHAFIFSDRQRVTPPRGTLLVHAIELETDKLTVFRNWNQYIFLPASDFLRSDFQRPGYQPFPSARSDNVLFADAPWWVRNPKVREVRPHTRDRGMLVSPGYLDYALWLVRAGPEPVQLHLALGGRRTQVRLEPEESRIIPITAPRLTFMSRTPHRFYSWHIRGEFGRALVHLATTPDEIAWALFNAGAYHEAASAFEEIRDEERSIGDRLAHQITALLAGRRPTELTAFDTVAAPTDPLLDHFGVSQRFIELLPGTTYGRDILRPYPVSRAPTESSMLFDHDLERTDVESPTTDTGKTAFSHFSQTPLTGFEPGHYTMRILMDGEPGPVRVQILDAFDRPIRTEHAVTKEHIVSLAFIADDERGWLRARVWGDQSTLLTVRELTFHPDPTTTMRSYAALAHMLKQQAFPDTELNPLMYRPLVHLGRRHQSNGEWAAAFEAYAAAIRADPDRLPAYEKLAEIAPHLPDQAETIERLLTPYRRTESLRTVHPAHVRLRNNMTLTGYQISRRTVRPGESFGLNLFWSLPHLHSRVPAYAAWLHGIHRDETEPSFYGDRHMMTILRLAPEANRLAPIFAEVHVPEDVRPGTYVLKTGMWIPSQRRNIRVAESSHPYDRRGVFLSEIEVVME